MATKNPRESLESIAVERLSQKILRDIDDIEIWEKPESGFSLKVDKKSFEFRLVVKTSTRNFLAWIGGLTSSIGGVIAAIKWITPIIVTYFSMHPP